MNSKKTGRENLKPTCSLSEMAESLGLSRSRFHQLRQKNVFPQPLYDIVTKRPFYNQQLQDRCLQIRDTGIGINNQQILFYRRRKKRPPASPDTVPQGYKVLVRVFDKLKIKTTPKELKAVLKELYPESLPARIDDNSVIQNLISHWGRR